MLSALEVFAAEFADHARHGPCEACSRAAGAAAAAAPTSATAAGATVRSMSHRVRVNPIACEAHGMCAELLPERITLDEWGYPLSTSTPLHGAQVEHAQPRGTACPTFALLVERERRRR